MPVIIDADDPRTVRAIEIAAEASTWQACRTRDGSAAYRVPSQTRPGHWYLVTHATCDCPDFHHTDTACKHVLAVRLHDELVRAVDHLDGPGQRRRHLRLVV